MLVRFAHAVTDAITLTIVAPCHSVPTAYNQLFWEYYTEFMAERRVSDSGEGDFAAARAVIEALPEEHDLRDKQESERFRMLTLIDFLESVHNDGRSTAQLNAGEIAQLEAFINVPHDRPTNWASNLLCYNYGICRSPYTGDAGAAPKSARARSAPKPIAVLPVLHLQPNPTESWVAVNYQIPNEAKNARLLVTDVAGRVIEDIGLQGAFGQHVMNTEAWARGSYAVRLIANSASLKTDRLIVQ